MLGWFGSESAIPFHARRLDPRLPRPDKSGVSDEGGDALCPPGRRRSPDRDTLEIEAQHQRAGVILSVSPMHATSSVSLDRLLRLGAPRAARGGEQAAAVPTPPNTRPFLSMERRSSVSAIARCLSPRTLPTRPVLLGGLEACANPDMR